MLYKHFSKLTAWGTIPRWYSEYRLDESDLPPAGRAFVRMLVEGVLERMKDLDELIAKYAPEWPVDQMAIIDRNILRIAIHEIATAENTPVKVAINEAVELAKVFGSGSSRRFVNGVLGSFVAQGGRLTWKADGGQTSDLDSHPDASEME